MTELHFVPSPCFLFRHLSYYNIDRVVVAPFVAARVVADVAVGVVVVAALAWMPWRISSAVLESETFQRSALRARAADSFG